MDMKYDAATGLGLDWASTIDERQAYAWEPAALPVGLREEDILGVEAALWTETLRTLADIEYMTFPRLPGYAEIGWSPAIGRSWEEYRERLGSHGPRLAALGVDFYRSELVPWK
jgi:hexosaminidase